MWFLLYLFLMCTRGSALFPRDFFPGVFLFCPSTYAMQNRRSAPRYRPIVQSIIRRIMKAALRPVPGGRAGGRSVLGASPSHRQPVTCFADASPAADHGPVRIGLDLTRVDAPCVEPTRLIRIRVVRASHQTPERLIRHAGL
jgi:hypothetical protein